MKKFIYKSEKCKGGDVPQVHPISPSDVSAVARWHHALRTANHRLPIGPYLLFACCLIAAALLCGCNDELTIDNTPVEQGGKKVTLTISVPANPGNDFEIVNTRVVDESLENTYTNLYLVAVDASSNIVKTIITLGDKLGDQDVEGWRSADIELLEGTYKFYVLANLDRYLENTTVDEYLANANNNRLSSFITNYINNFSTDIPILAGNLPMACPANKMQYQVYKRNSWGIGGSYVWETATTEQIKITDDEKQPYLRATLTYLCAKVKYTILFDARSQCISEKFGNNRIRLLNDNNYKPRVENINGKANTGYDIELDRYTFEPEQLSSTNYESSSYSLPTLTLFNEGLYTMDDWLGFNHKAWQGVVYLPESPNNNKPYLVFPYTFGGVDAEKDGEQRVTLFDRTDLKAGISYELIIKVTDPNKFNIVVKEENDNNEPSGWYLIYKLASEAYYYWPTDFVEFENPVMFYKSGENEFQTEILDLPEMKNDSYYMMIYDSENNKFYGKNSNQYINLNSDYNLTPLNKSERSSVMILQDYSFNGKAILKKVGDNYTLTLQPS